MVHRLDSVADIDAIFARDSSGTTAGAWIADSGGSTPSSNTGPGTNSAGGYVFSETSQAGSEQQIEDNSVLTVLQSVMDAWAVPGRVLAMRACVQGAGWIETGEGAVVEGRAGDSDPWTRIALIQGWAYSNTYAEDDEITDRGGDALTCAQAGGWVDFEVDIPDAHAQIRLRSEIEGPQSAYHHDWAIWQIEFRDGATATTATATAGGRHATRGSAAGTNAPTTATATADGRHTTRGSATGTNTAQPTTATAGGRHATRGSATGTNGQGLQLPDGAWVRTVDGDVLDEICWRHYGREDAVPAVLVANPGLSEQGPALAGGLIVALPDLPDPAPVMAAVRLWDRADDA